MSRAYTGFFHGHAIVLFPEIVENSSGLELRLTGTDQGRLRGNGIAPGARRYDASAIFDLPSIASLLDKHPERDRRLPRGQRKRHSENPYAQEFLMPNHGRYNFTVRIDEAGTGLRLSIPSSRAARGVSAFLRKRQRLESGLYGEQPRQAAQLILRYEG